MREIRGSNLHGKEMNPNYTNQIKYNLIFEWKMTPSTCHIAQWPVVKLEISLKYQT